MPAKLLATQTSVLTHGLFENELFEFSSIFFKNKEFKDAQDARSAEARFTMLLSVSSPLGMCAS